MTVLLSTGLYHVVANDGPLPFWVEVRTYNKRPIIGAERRVRGFDAIEAAIRYMRRATADALKADSTLGRYLTSKDGSPPPEPSSTPPRGRGRPPGSKSKPKAERQKPGPKPKPAPATLSDRLVPFSSTRFVLRTIESNPVAQLWYCETNEAKAKGRAAGKSAVRTGDMPHRAGSLAVTRLVNGELVCAVDDLGRPVIYHSVADARRDAEYFYEIAPGPKPEIYGEVQYDNGIVEVRLCRSADLSHHPYSVFDNRHRKYARTASGQVAQYTRLDRAIEAANAYLANTRGPASMRLISLLSETPAERAAREVEEEAILAGIKRKEEAADRAAAEHDKLMEKIAAKNRDRVARLGRRMATPEEIAAEQAKKTPLLNPTPEQKLQARRKKYAPRGSYNQRRKPEEDTE